MKKVAIYARVSTSDQKTDMQLRDLRKYAKSRNLKIYKEYIDHGVSGAKKDRPALNKMMDDAQKKLFDVVIVWRFDRFARSTKHLVDALHTFRNLRIDFISYQENIDTSSPMGEAMFTIISAMAQLEKDIISERVKAGLQNARAKGKTLGRKKIELSKADMNLSGGSLRKRAKELGVSAATLSRRINKGK